MAATYQSSAAIEALSRNTNINYVEADFNRYIISGLRGEERKSSPDNPSSFENNVGATVHCKLDHTVTYAIVKAEADQISLGETSKTVCIIDSGYKLGHKDIPPSGVDRQDVGGAGPWFEDGDSHGTYVAGTVASLDNGVVVVGVMASNINIYIVHVIRDNGS